MGLINKLVLVCDGVPTTYGIGLEDSDASGIQASLDTIPSGLGTFTYSFETNSAGLIASILTITDATCTPFLYKDDIPYTATLVSGDVVLQIGQGTTPIINTEVSIASQVFAIEECCDTCKAPQFVNEVYEGDTFIPYSLAMIDGTYVSIDSLGGDTMTFSERGCIELAEPLVAGQEIRLKVNDCETYSPPYIVKSEPSDCDFSSQSPCFIKVLSISVETVNSIYGRIKSLNTSSYGDLKYRIDNGEWVDSWTELGNFPLNNGVTIGIKSKANPSCKIQYPIVVIQKFA